MGFPDLHAYFSLRSSKRILLGKTRVLSSGKVICPEKSLRSLSKCYFYYPVHLLFSFRGSVEIPERESSPQILQLCHQRCKSWFLFLCSTGDTRDFSKLNRAVCEADASVGQFFPLFSQLIHFSSTKTITLYSICYR